MLSIFKRTGLIAVILFWLALAVLLTARFYLMIYFPGTPDTEALFDKILPHWESFSWLTHVFLMPVQILSDVLISPLLPTEWQAVFPEMPATVLFANPNLSAEEARALYPGQVEWITLLAIVVWFALLIGAYAGISYLKDFFKGFDISQVSMPEFKLPKLKRPKDTVDESETEEPQTARQPNDPNSGLRNRLGDIKAEAASNALKTPQLSPSEQYKATKGPVSSEAAQRQRNQMGDGAFQQMMSDLRQENMQLQSSQQQLRSTYSQYFSPNVIQYLEQNKTSFENMQNKNQTVSILFCDIRDFAVLSQKLSPEELAAFLDNYFNITLSIILNVYDGVISKLMGDSVMAYWGFPIPNPDHAYVATRTAFHILQRVHQHNQENPDSTLAIGIGVATGEAMIGNVGSQDYKDFTLIGNPVNLAARLDDANREHGTQLLISPETYVLVKDRIDCKSMGKIPIQGWDQPMDVYAPRKILK